MISTMAKLTVPDSQTRQTGLARFRFTRRVSSLISHSFLAALAFAIFSGAPVRAQSFTCTPPSVNQIVCENSFPGTPENVWQVSGAGDATIQGFATNISVNQGGTISFKINTNASSYNIDIYRMGFYQGNGARFLTSVSPSAKLPQTQPACLTDAATKLYDCGNWAVSGSWQVPATATSGIYFALLTRNDTGGQSQIWFIVRNDSGHSDILYQASDQTWQAYNDYGGHSLYGGAGTFDLANRANKVSYNRPFDTRNFEALTWLYNAEYPMIRWLEANGYDVSYSTGTDAARSGSLILNHKIYVSSGHDEYWSGPQRTNVEAARNAGVNLAFFSGNEVFWKTRWENSIDGTNTPYRTLVCYKETLGEAKIDPSDPPTWTGTWRDPSFSPPADGGRPENSLTGTIFMVNGPGTDNTALSMKVPAADGKMRFWRNTSIANLAAGQTATLPEATLGYEWDEDLDNGARPAGSFQLSTATYTLTADLLLDYGGTYGAGTATHHMTMHRAQSGALVFGAGSVQWAYGLDSDHDTVIFPPPNPDVDMQQATVNLFADMGAQPGSIQAGLTHASKSTDVTPPASKITSPANGGSVQQGNSVTITGTAADSGGGVVGGVEVSVNDGITWHPAAGRESWTYTYVPLSTGTISIMSRAVDDSGNLETPTAGSGNTISATVTPRTCPCNIWGNSFAPNNTAAPDSSALELGIQFTSDRPGAISGIRFYKGAGNTGTHVGHLWTSGGTQLGSVTFTGESATGWQDATFATPIYIDSNTTYVASYSDPVGNYAADSNYFASAGFDNAPLHALSVSDGVYSYGPGTFPSNTFRSANYWVDLTFIDKVAPGSAISNVSVSLITASGAGISWQTDQSSTSRVDYGTSPNALNSNMQLSSLVTSHNVTLTGLAANTTYYFRVTSVNNLGGSTTSPAAANAPISFVTPPGSVTDTTVADFSAGTPDVNTYVSDIYDGEVILNPTVGTEFSGTSLPTGWTVTPWNTGGTGTVSGGVLSVDGALVQTTALFAPGRSIEFVATFSGAAYQHAGFTEASFSGPWAIFSTMNGTGFFARTNNGSTSTDTPIAGNWLGAPHRFRIDWTSSGVVYWIDGTQVATHAISIAGVMQPAISDYNVAGGQVVVDWVHLTPYASTATFASRVLDAGASVNWLAANWKSVLPAGTNLVISERTGDAPTPDGSWTGWTQLAGSGAAVAGYSRYIQYQAQLSTSNVGQTPELDNITFTFNPGVRTTPPIISNISVSSITTTGATISWTTDEPSTTQVNYGTTTSLGSSASSGGSVTSHSVALSGLASGTQYFYQVKSVDSNNNVGVSAQSSFSTVAVRTVPPVISNVVVTPGSGGTATISWTTDEVATSQVNYGTTSTTLNSTVSNSTMVTSHSLTLSGLALGVKYFYQVSSLDVWGFTGTYPASGNPPASFTMPPGTLIDTTVADFSAGTPDANTYISQTNNGEVILNPTAGTEFSGTTLQSGWAVQTIWNTGGSAVVTNGTVTVDAASVGTTATYGPGSSMEFVATFSTDTYENAGLGVDFSTTPWAIFSTKDGSALFVRTNNGATSTDTAIPGNWIGTPHRYRIDWTTSGVVYSIDGTQVASHPIAITTNMRPLVSDYNLGNGALVVDWIRLTPYSTPAVFVSRVLDAGASVNWLNAKWTSVLPAGTALTISVRTGNTATPDATWTVFTAVSSSGGSLTGSSRYIQYQAQLSTTNSTQTPALNDITLSYSQPIP